MGAHAYYSRVVWSEQDNWVVHGYTTLAVVGEVWFVALSTCICKVWNIILIVMAIALHSIIDCEPLKILRVYEGTCFEHVMSEAYRYITNDDKDLLHWKMWMWRKFKLVYKKPLSKPKSLKMGSKNESILVLKMGCNIEY